LRKQAPAASGILAHATESKILPPPKMRQERTVQASIFDVFAAHEIGHELKAMSQWLDEHCDLLGLVTRDSAKIGVKATGRRGLPAETVLRSALLKQYRQLSYQELAFHLEDSASFRAFARLPLSWSPQKSVLQKTVTAIRPETCEQINRALLSGARHAKLEDGAVEQPPVRATRPGSACARQRPGSYSGRSAARQRHRRPRL
jgi:IS5 family transposase